MDKFNIFVKVFLVFILLFQNIFIYSLGSNVPINNDLNSNANSGNFIIVCVCILTVFLYSYFVHKSSIEGDKIIGKEFTVDSTSKLNKNVEIPIEKIPTDELNIFDYINDNNLFCILVSHFIAVVIFSYICWSLAFAIYDIFYPELNSLDNGKKIE
jgi:hypothetical protein